MDIDTVGCNLPVLKLTTEDHPHENWDREPVRELSGYLFLPNPNMVYEKTLREPGIVFCQGVDRRFH